MPISRLSFGSNDDFNFPPLVCCSNNTLSKLLNVSLVSGTIVNGRLRGGKIWFLPRLGDCRFVAHASLRIRWNCFDYCRCYVAYVFIDIFHRVNWTKWECFVNPCSDTNRIIRPKVITILGLYDSSQAYIFAIKGFNLNLFFQLYLIYLFPTMNSF